MAQPIIKVENLYKQYRLGTVGTGTLSHDLNRWYHKLMGKEDPYEKISAVNDRTKKDASSEYVWALQNINFELNQGDVLGVIGRNGAGKSTLLKILSKVTAPTKGHIKIRGRIASLLEVGTGFHGELTGGENIYLNGAILGMTKSEIKAKFDEIVEFSGVGKYVDTPVKRYSSGMYMRLAFAVSAHLDQEILVVDEVLAVGDADFQKKCIGKMKDVSTQEGRTVLFVSHNMSAVQNLCNKGLLLVHGQVHSVGEIEPVIKEYQNVFSNGFEQEISLTDHPRKRGIGFVRFDKLKFNLEQYEPDSKFEISFGLKANMDINEIKGIHISAYIVDSLGAIVYHLSTTFDEHAIIPFSESSIYKFTIEKLRLKPGGYSVWIWLQANGLEQDYIDQGIQFDVEEGNIYGHPRSDISIGLVQLDSRFEIIKNATH
jgi:lipopolysaccharide transport system ATP-binding protein